MGVSKTDWDQTPWMRSTSIHEHVIKFSTAKVYVLSWSALCLGGKIAEYPQSVQSWTKRIEWFTQPSLYRELDSVDGEPVVFECKIFTRHTTLKLLWEVQTLMEKKITFSQMIWRIESSSCRCTTTSIDARKAIKKVVNRNFSDVAEHAEKPPQKTLVIPRTWIWRKMVCYARP